MLRAGALLRAGPALRGVVQPTTASAAEPSTAPPAADSMVVTLPGTGSPPPRMTRLGASTLVRSGGLNVVFDAGRGCPIRLNQIGVPLGGVDGVFLTHHHSDHVNGLLDSWTTSCLSKLLRRSVRRRPRLSRRAPEPGGARRRAPAGARARPGS